MNITSKREATRPMLAVAFLSVIAAIGAAVSVVLIEVLERRWDALDCSNSGVDLLERLQWTALVLAAVALVLGLVALFGRTPRTSWLGVSGIVISLVVAALMFLPTVMPSAPEGLQDIGSFQCGSSTP